MRSDKLIYALFDDDHGHVYGRLVDARRLRQFAILLEIPRLISVVFMDDVHLCVNDD